MDGQVYFIGVAVPVPLARLFTYRSSQAIRPGQRLKVPFGNRKLIGLAFTCSDQPPPAEEGAGVEWKEIAEVIDDGPLFSQVLLDLAQWMSSYYHFPIGEVVKAMLPAAAVKKKKMALTLTLKGSEARLDAGHPQAKILNSLFLRKKTEISKASAFAKLKALAPEQRPQDLIKVLKRQGLIGESVATDMVARSFSDLSSRDLDVEAIAGREKALTAAQLAVFAQIQDQSLRVEKKGAPFLLFGLTGSGKTEIYMQAIATLLKEAVAGPLPQALMLVPEISLTPQMTRVFEARFPGQVAVVHSEMPPAERWQALERIRRQDARILLGPRSAVFGPFANLRLIIVDEEHDHSYKQATGLTYNGRDIAVLRGKLENATVILGSATPSMESLHNAHTGKYRYLELRERVQGRALPSIALVNVDKARMPSMSFRAGQEAASVPEDQMAIDPVVLQSLRETLAEKQQAMVIVNRRGYAYYLFSLREKAAVACPHCSISLTVHGKRQALRCHYCDYQTTVAEVLRSHPRDEFMTVGYGSQQAESFLKQALPKARIVRIDSDTVSERGKLQEVLGRFAAGDIDILVGTQILAKGHDFPNVTLIAILEVDQSLALPDFRAGERTFQLVVQAAGRAGRHGHQGKVLIQTARPDHPVIESGVAQNYPLFAEREMQFRRLHHYPPFSKMVALEFNAEDPRRLDAFAEKVRGMLVQLFAMHPKVFELVQVLGPSIPAIERIRKRYRRSLLLTAPSAPPLAQLVRLLDDGLRPLPADVRVRIDVDPQSLM